jgi:scyllo-inositol 2-dehydrogenase (NADP+)
MPPPLQAGIVGYGYASKTFHAPLLSAVPGIRLAAISSSEPAKVRADWPQVQVFDSHDQLFTSEEIELIVIPTPNETHFPLAGWALAAGKHVVVDKPFTLTIDEARVLIKLASRHGRLLSVFHNRRWDADFLSLQAVLREGSLGRVTHFESHFDRYRPEVRARWRESAAPGAGLWYDLGPHLLDQAVQLFGEPQAIWLDLARQRDGAVADDWFHAVLRYDALRVVLHASALVPALGPRLTVHGTAGSFVKFGLDPQEDALKAGQLPGGEGWGVDPQPGRLILREGEAVHEQTIAGAPGNYLAYYGAIRDAIRLGAPNPVPAEQALQVMRLIELGLASANEGRVLAVAPQ